MRERLDRRLAECQEEIELARFCAAIAATSDLKLGYARLERQWRQLADDLRFSNEISGYLEWRLRRFD
jgi:hypothetical protein